MAVYTVSDVHGAFDLFMTGLETIGFSDSDFLYVIGDAIDRGKNGIDVLKYIMSHDNIDLLIGNHEFMMLNSVSFDGSRTCHGSDAQIWRNWNGGNTTWKAYCKLGSEDRSKLLSWLRKRYVIKTVRVDNRSFCLTHSHYKRSCENKLYCELDYPDVFSITWTSIYRDDPETHNPYNIYENYDYTFITGHVPVQLAGGENELRALINGNLIDIDGGCSMGSEPGLNNGLIFLRLDDMKEVPVPWASLE